MVMPVAQVGPRKVSYTSVDYTGVPSLKARRGTAPDNLVIVEQLTESLAQNRAELELLISNVQVGDLNAEIAARIAADLVLEQRLTAQISNIILQGIRQKVAVGARVTEIPLDLNTVPGFTPGAANPAGRLFVDSDSASSGIYQAVGGALTRDPAFMTAADFQPGLMIWVDGNTAVDANTFWVLEDEATGTGNSVTANFEPFGRMQDLIAILGGAISIVGNTISWNYDAAFLAVVNGNATLSDIFKARIDAIESDANQAVADIAEIKTINNQQASAIANLTTENQQQGTAISSVSARTTAVESSTATNTSSIASLTTRTTSVESAVVAKADTSTVTALSNRTAVVETATTANAADITALSARTTTVEAAVTTKASATDVVALTTRTTAVESVVTTKADSTTVSALSDRTATVESATTVNAAGITALSARTTTVESALISKASTTDVTALSARTTTVESTVATKADSATVTTLSTRTTTIEGVIAAITSVRVLTSGVAELFTEPDGSKWTKTTFTVTFPAGSKYRLLATTLSASPKVTLTEHAQPSYPGNTCVIPFFTPVGAGDALMPIDNNAIEAMFVNFAAVNTTNATQILGPGSSITFTNGAQFVIDANGIFTAIRADNTTMWGPSPTDWLELKVNSTKGIAFARLNGTYEWTKLSADFFIDPPTVMTQAEYNDF